MADFANHHAASATPPLEQAARALWAKLESFREMTIRTDEEYAAFDDVEQAIATLRATLDASSSAGVVGEGDSK